MSGARRAQKRSQRSLRRSPSPRRTRMAARAGAPRGDRAWGDAIPDRAAQAAAGALTARGPGGLDTVYAALYEQLRTSAQALMRSERRDHFLQPTALVHEAWMRLAGAECAWDVPQVVARTAVRAMRRVLVDHARHRARERTAHRGKRYEIDRVADRTAWGTAGVVALDETLARFAALDRRAAAVVELRVFGGLSLPEVAFLLGVDPRTAERDWTWARAWLHAELTR